MDQCKAQDAGDPKVSTNAAWCIGLLGTDPAHRSATRAAGGIGKLLELATGSNRRAVSHAAVSAMANLVSGRALLPYQIICRSREYPGYITPPPRRTAVELTREWTEWLCEKALHSGGEDIECPVQLIRLRASRPLTLLVASDDAQLAKAAGKVLRSLATVHPVDLRASLVGRCSLTLGFRS